MNNVLTRGRRIAISVLGLTLVLAAGCSSERKVVSSNADSVTVPGVTIPGISIPDISIPDLSIPDLSIPGLSIPDISIPDLSIPGVSIPDINSTTEALDFVIEQMELAGVTVDRACVEEFLKDTEIQKQINDSQGQLPPALLQQFIGCIST